jgi:tetratricopeptide (TPR) repeat protein
MPTRSTLRRTLGSAAALALVTALAAVADAQVEGDLREGDRYFEDGQWKKAAAAYDAAIRRFPAQVPAEAYGKRAAIFLNQQDLDGGLRWIREVAKKQHPGAPEVLEQEAVILWQLGRKGDAITAADAAVQGRPSAFAAQLLIGQYFYATDAGRTVAAYEAYLAHRPGELAARDVLPRLQLGFSYLRVGDAAGRDGDAPRATEAFGNAVRQFEVLKQKHARDARAVVNAENGLCTAYTATGRFDQAITVCEQIVRDPRRVDDDRAVWFNLGTAYLQKKQFGKARGAATEFRKARRPESKARAEVLFGDAYFAEGDYQRALESYQQAEKGLRGREQAALAVKMGLAYARGPRPDFRKAVEKLEAARVDNGGDAALAIALADAYLGLADDARALTVAESVINLASFDRTAAVDRAALRLAAGKAAYNLRKGAQARGHLVAARALSARDVEVRDALVAVIQREAHDAFTAGDLAAADALLKEAATVHPEAASVRVSRAVLSLKAGDCAGAQGHLAGVGAAVGYVGVYHRLMARSFTCLPTPDLARAVQHYGQAEQEARRTGDNLLLAEVHAEVAPLLARQGAASQEVVTRLEDAVQFAGAPEHRTTIADPARRNLAVALYRRGWALLREGKAEAAVADFERASREPRLLRGIEPLAFECSLALAQLDRGETTEAARLFKALADKGDQGAYLRAPYDKVGATFFAAYAGYRNGNRAQREGAAREFQRLAGSASGAFKGKVNELLASSWEFVAYDDWRAGKNARKALQAAEKGATGDLQKRVAHNLAVLDMGPGRVEAFEAFGGTPAEALVNLGILLDQAGKPREAYDAWVKAAARGATARDLKKWIDAKRRIYGFN